MKWQRADGDWLELRLASGATSLGLWPGSACNCFYADWFVLGNDSFRVVSGTAFEDSTSITVQPAGLGAASYSNSDNNLILRKRPRAFTYMGVGYSQSGRSLGLYADMGLALARSTAQVEDGTSQATAYEGWLTQNKSWLGLAYQPSVSLRLVYRY